MKTSSNMLKERQTIRPKVVVMKTNGQNFGLSKSEFENLAICLRNGEERLFEKIFLSHFENCKKYLINNYNASDHVAHDITMDTLIEFRKYILLDKINYGNLRYLFTKMASQNLLRFYKKNRKTDFSPFYIEREFEDKEHLFDALSTAWEELDTDTRILLEAFYYNKIPLVDLAKKTGITDASMRKKKQRGIEKLRTIFMKIVVPKNKNHAKYK